MKRFFIYAAISAIVMTGCRPAASPSMPVTLPLLPGAPALTATLGPDQPLATTAAEILGTWQGVFGGAPLYLIFREDGILSSARSADGSGSLPGTYVFEGTKLLLKADLPFEGCGLDSTGYYEVRLQRQAGNTSALQFVMLDDICGVRVHSLTEETRVWTRY